MWGIIRFDNTRISTMKTINCVIKEIVEMGLEALKKQWKKYCDEFEKTEEMDIEKHINMASKVGLLIKEVERYREGFQEMFEKAERYEKTLKWIVENFDSDKSGLSDEEYHKEMIKKANESLKY
jgi:hypothetical protein